MVPCGKQWTEVRAWGLIPDNWAGKQTGLASPGCRGQIWTQVCTSLRQADVSVSSVTLVDVHPFNGGCCWILRIFQHGSEQHSSEHSGSCHLLRDLVQALEPGNSSITKPDLLLLKKQLYLCMCARPCVCVPTHTLSICCIIELNP